MNTDKNTALYEKMAAEQDKFRDWLKSQPPEEILKHTYEYTVREDILMAMEELDLPQSRAAALLASPSPLADVYKEFLTGKLPTWMWCGTASSSGAEAALDAQRELAALPPRRRLCPANRATWICTGRPAAPTSPARRPSRHSISETLPGQPAGQRRGAAGDRAVRLHPNPLCAGKHRTAEGMGWTVQPG